jgi:hypothetical protein
VTASDEWAETARNPMFDRRKQMTDDPLAAALTEIRDRYARVFDASGRVDLIAAVNAARDDMPRLLALAEAALKMAGDWGHAAKRLDDMAERADARGADPMRVTQVSADAQAHRDRAAALTEVIARELTGKAADGAPA